jgi:hypothetical protein
MTRVPHTPDRVARWGFFVLLPLYFGFGFALGGERLFEHHSFQAGAGARHLAYARVLGKDRIRGRRGRADSFHARVQSPFADRTISLGIDRTLSSTSNHHAIACSCASNERPTERPE